MNTQKPLQIKAQNDFRTIGSSTFQVIRGGLFGAMQPENNWAFIDLQNLCKAVQGSGWKVGWKPFMSLLRSQYNVSKAIVFLGYVSKNEGLYRKLWDAGFTPSFRTVRELPDGQILGGNIDADLTSFVMDHKREYTKAVVIADDGGYCNTLKSLRHQNKLKKIISTHTIERTSQLTKRTFGIDMIDSIENIRHLIEYKQKLVP